MGFHTRCDATIGYFQKRVIELEEQLAEHIAKADEEKRALIDRLVEVTDPSATRARAAREAERLHAERIAATAAGEPGTVAYPSTPAPGPRVVRPAATVIPPNINQHPRARVASPAPARPFDPTGSTPGPVGPGGIRAPLQTLDESEIGSGTESQP